MHAVGPSSAIFLFCVLVLLPWAAIRSSRAFNAQTPSDGAPPMPPRRPLPSRPVMYVNTTIMLSALFALSWFTARTFQYRIFAAPDIGLREIAAGGAALVFCVCLSLAGTRLRSPDEIRSMPINRLMPETARETVLYSITGIAAGIAEEAAYRGVLMHVLWYALGNPWVAVASSAAAFSLGHVLQGWKSMAVIFVLALAMHALVWFTGTLVIAMAVHALYDLLAPTLRRRTLRALPTGPGRSAG